MVPVRVEEDSRHLRFHHGAETDRSRPSLLLARQEERLVCWRISKEVPDTTPPFFISPIFFARIQFKFMLTMNFDHPFGRFKKKLEVDQ